MKLSIIIPTLKKNKEYLDFCINSLKENTRGLEFEIIVAENGEGTNYPQGQCQAVNKASRQAQGEWLFIVNDDMFFPPAWNKNIRWNVSDCFSPNVNFTDAPDERLTFVDLPAGNGLDFDKLMVDAYVANLTDLTIENGWTMPVFIKKSLWYQIEGYDENYDPWGSNSDSDVEYKVVLAGVQPKKQKGVFVYHFGLKSGTFDGTHQDYWQKNWNYFVDKWGFDREDTPFIQRADLHIPLDRLKYHPNYSVYV